MPSLISLNHHQTQISLRFGQKLHLLPLGRRRAVHPAVGSWPAELGCTHPAPSNAAWVHGHDRGWSQYNTPLPDGKQPKIMGAKRFACFAGTRAMNKPAASSKRYTPQRTRDQCAQRVGKRRDQTGACTCDFCPLRFVVFPRFVHAWRWPACKARTLRRAGVVAPQHSTPASPLPEGGGSVGWPVGLAYPGAMKSNRPSFPRAGKAAGHRPGRTLAAIGGGR